MLLILAFLCCAEQAPPLPPPKLSSKQSTRTPQAERVRYGTVDGLLIQGNKNNKITGAIIVTSNIKSFWNNGPTSCLSEILESSTLVLLSSSLSQQDLEKTTEENASVTYLSSILRQQFPTSTPTVQMFKEPSCP